MIYFILCAVRPENVDLSSLGQILQIFITVLETLTLANLGFTSKQSFRFEHSFSLRMQHWPLSATLDIYLAG